MSLISAVIFSQVGIKIEAPIHLLLTLFKYDINNGDKV